MPCAGSPAGFNAVQASLVREFMHRFATMFAEECRSSEKLPKVIMEDYLRCMRERLKSKDGSVIAGYLILQAMVTFLEGIDKVLTAESTVEDFLGASKQTIELTINNVSILPMNFLTAGFSG